MAHYFQALEDLNHTDYQNRYPDAETSYNNNAAISEYINIGVLNADLNMFRDDAVDIGALLIQGQDSLFYDNPGSSISPYDTYRNAFVATPLKRVSRSKNIIFKLQTDYWKETAQYNIQKLEIDFGDGNGYITVQKDQSIVISYNSYGEKEVKLKATFTNKTVKIVEATLKIVGFTNSKPLKNTYTPGTKLCSFEISNTFSSEHHTFQGYDESQAYSGRGSYENFSETECLTKPVIVVEGYDPADNNGHFALYDDLNKNSLGDNLISTNHDVITLNFEPRAINGKIVPGGTDYIERNAMVLVKLIEMINDEKTKNAEPTKIIGFSMGGLVARYALRYMEINNLSHDVDLYASVDSPHQGANVPSGVQHTVQLIDDLVPSWLNEELGGMEDELNYPATKQMLNYHYKNSSFYNTFYDNLNAMGYPQDTRNIAVANGSMNGSGINDINQKYYEGKAHLLWVLLNGKLRLNFTRNSGSARVFYWRVKSFGVNVHKREKSINTNPAIGSFENAPAGYVALDNLNDKVLDFSKIGFDWFVAGMSQQLSSEKFSFIPTKSAIDYQDDPYLFQDISANLVCANKTPFDTYFSIPFVNESHMYLHSETSDFLYQEILGNPQDPSGEFNLPYGSYYNVDLGSQTDLELDNTLPGRVPFPQTFPKNVKVNQVTPLGASSINWTLFSDDDNAVANWHHSGSYLDFDYHAHKTDADILFKYSFNDECDITRNIIYSFNILEPENGLNSLDDSYTVYPIPADYEINIVSENNDQDNSLVKLYDFNGLKVKEDTFNNNSELQINTSTLNNGMYFLEISNDNQEFMKQIVIQH
ncbi:MAG TPA: T9SS type A sorting domain-containing protein [Flavobacteriaceae bacterium]|nr:T9SS type A sorting domain-containing protein [Flavobacteriaceae bacterium]